MHNLIEFEAWRAHREELAQQMARERLALRLRSGRPKPRARGAIAGLIRGRIPDRPQTAG